jgi:hypothetical protein
MEDISQHPVYLKWKNAALQNKINWMQGRCCFECGSKRKIELYKKDFNILVGLRFWKNINARREKILEYELLCLDCQQKRNNTKRCSVCRERKTLEAFHKKYMQRHNSQCIECQKGYKDKHYLENKEEYKLKNNRRYKEYRHVIDKLKSAPCQGHGKVYSGTLNLRKAILPCPL